MSYISPEGPSCVTRPWGNIECDCEFDFWGNAACQSGNKSEIPYKQLIKNIKENEIAKSAPELSSGSGGFTDRVWYFFKAIVFVCE